MHFRLPEDFHDDYVDSEAEAESGDAAARNGRSCGAAEASNATGADYSLAPCKCVRSARLSKIHAYCWWLPSNAERPPTDCARQRSNVVWPSHDRETTL